MWMVIRMDQMVPDLHFRDWLGRRYYLKETLLPAPTFLRVCTSPEQDMSWRCSPAIGLWFSSLFFTELEFYPSISITGSFLRRVRAREDMDSIKIVLLFSHISIIPHKFKIWDTGYLRVEHDISLYLKK
jgi:hypothetical protein